MCKDEITNIQERKISSFCDLRCHKKDRDDEYEYNFCGGVNYMSVWSSKNIFSMKYCFSFTQSCTLHLDEACKEVSEKFITCSELIQCRDGAMRSLYGGCHHCKSGFVGKYCISRSI